MAGFTSDDLTGSCTDYPVVTIARFTGDLSFKDFSPWGLKYDENRTVAEAFAVDSIS